jgi:predicted permease
MWQRPMLSAAAITCLALGIGANTSIFSIATGVLSRPMPGVADPDRLIAIHRTSRGTCCGEGSWPIYRDLQGVKSIFAGVETHFPLLSVTLVGSGEPETIWGQLVSTNYFAVLGVRPLLGRAFTGDETSAEPVVVISHSLWQHRFGADRAIIGRSIALNNSGFTVVAVAPPGFRGSDLALAPDIWVPFTHIARVMPQRPSLEDRNAAWLVMHARLQPGVGREQAQAALDVVARCLEQTNRDTDEGRGFLAEPARAFYPSYRGAIVNTLGMVMAIAGLVLLVACANVANILLARAHSRGREIAIRLALGATRRRLIQEMLTESLMLGLTGGAAGLLLAVALSKVLGAIRLPVSMPIEFNAPFEWQVLAFTAVLSLATSVIFGLAPALGVSRPDLVASLKGGRQEQRMRRISARDVLVAGQVSASVLLLAVSLLFVRSLLSVSGIDPGFRTDHLVLMSLDPRPYGDPERVMNRLRERLASAPGVLSATYADVLPLGLGARAANVKAPETDDAQHAPVRADMFSVGPDYFRTLGIRIVRGSSFRDAGEGAGRVAVVNELAAAQLWPGQDPIGKGLLRDGVSHRVVGVVANWKSRTIGEAERACVFVLFEQNGSQPIPFGMSLLVRTDREPAAMVATIRRTIHDVEPRLAISNMRSMERQLLDSLALPRAGAWLFGAFGLVGILLTTAGVYGVVSHTVAGRTREFGIRCAIGARSVDVLWLVLRQGLTLGVVGALPGLAAALAVSRIFGSLLYGVRSADPLAFTVAPVTVIAVALLASYVPARRAAAVDPIAALHSD